MPPCTKPPGAPYLLLGGDVVINEGDALVRTLTPHACDPGHRHLAGLDGRFGPITAQLSLLLQQTRGELRDRELLQPRVTWPSHSPVPSCPTSFSVTNSASSPTRSPACGISLSMRGMKVAWHLRCLRAREASASSTLASIGFLTAEGKGDQLGAHSLSPQPAPLRHSLTRLYLELRFLRA